MPISQKNTFQPKMNVKGSTFLNLLNEIADVCFNVKHMVGYTDSGIVIDHTEFGGSKNDKFLLALRVTQRWLRAGPSTHGQRLS